MEGTIYPSVSLLCSYRNCGKILSSKYNLRRHIESCHYGFRPYECHVCFKRFSSKQNKREHIRLEHSYSYSAEAMAEGNNTFKGENLQIPSLSVLLLSSTDPEIRPMSKVERIFLYADLCEQVEIPHISQERQRTCTLPYHQ